MTIAHMEKSEHQKIIHDSHKMLSAGYGDLDIHGQVERNTLKHWNYQRNVREPITQIVLKYLKKRPFKMLDAGCGNGQLFHLYHELGTESICGVDFGSAMLNQAIQRAEVNNIKFLPVKANLEDLSCIKDLRFDLINLYGVIEHLIDPVAVLKELEMLLTHKGIMIISVPRKWSLAWMSYFLFARSLANYAQQESQFEMLLRKKKMTLYRFYSNRDMLSLISGVSRLKLLDRISIAHGGIVGKWDSSLQKFAKNGNYRAIDRWNTICENLGLVPAGEYLVLCKS